MTMTDACSWVQSAKCQSVLKSARGLDRFSRINKGAQILNHDLSRFVQSTRIAYPDKDDCDMLIYLSWKTEMLTNEKISALFGLTYSSVSHSVKAVKSGLDQDLKLKDKFDRLNSQFKI